MSVFTKCAKGHDLTIQDAYLYSSNGHRQCRECAKANGGGNIKKKPKFTLNGKPAGK